MKVLLLEDHAFFASELIEYFQEETTYELVYVKSYKEAVEAFDRYKNFDFAILDVILQNGKTGVDIAKKFKDKISSIMFLTGCCDSSTLSTLKDYIVVSKLDVIWPKLEDFFKGNLKSLKDTPNSLYTAN